jgi:hypothetical protein
VLVLQGDQGAVERDAVGERLRPVDRVEHPPAAGGARALGLLLAEDGVVGEPLGDQLAQQPLGAPVGHGDRGAVGLAVDLEAGRAEVLERQLTGAPGQVDGGIEQFGVDRGRHDRQLGTAGGRS